MDKNKLPKPMTPKQIKAKREKEQKRKLEEIRANAFARGQRMAARQIAEREGFMAGLESVQGKQKTQKGNKRR